MSNVIAVKAPKAPKAPVVINEDLLTPAVEESNRATPATIALALWLKGQEARVIDAHIVAFKARTGDAGSAAAIRRVAEGKADGNPEALSIRGMAYASQTTKSKAGGGATTPAPKVMGAMEVLAAFMALPAGERAMVKQLILATKD